MLRQFSQETERPRVVLIVEQDVLRLPSVTSCDEVFSFQNPRKSLIVDFRDR